MSYMKDLMIQNIDHVFGLKKWCRGVILVEKPVKVSMIIEINLGEIVYEL